MAAKRNSYQKPNTARKTPAVDNPGLEKAMKNFIAEKNGENMAAFMAELKTSQLLVPAQIPGGMDKAALTRMIRQGQNGKMPRLNPILVQNTKGERFAPVFTSKKQLPQDQKYQIILNTSIDEVMRIAQEPSLNLSGIIVNPATDKLILHPKFIEKMKEAASGVKSKKEVKMTREQFTGFSRRNVERRVIPGRIYSEKADFMAALEEQREKLIMDIYRQPYGDKIPFPYTDEDFSVMLLDIDEQTTVASIELPAKNITPQSALSMYFIWNPVTEDIQYFIISKGPKGEDNVLCRISADGECEELMTAPPTGSEISSILDIIREEAEEE